MKIIEPSYEIMDKIEGNIILKRLELCGRVCYKSEKAITEESAKIFIQNIIKSGHESVLEHEKVTVRIICDRGLHMKLSDIELLVIVRKVQDIVTIVKKNLMEN